MYALRRIVTAVTLAAGALAVPAVPASAHILDTDPVAAYGLEEGAGGTVHDVSGNGHDGTVQDDVRTYNAALTPRQIKSIVGTPVSPATERVR
ncbi:hypothetical protein [Nonomuraea sp. NPDC049695]|uniref:hypothetical protein n=1 Tax=Nonomuraea sp. NPDC049695 TaxID=3154734 RepID=UPI00343AEA8A